MKHESHPILKRFVPILAWLARFERSWTSYCAYVLTFFLLFSLGAYFHHFGTGSVISIVLLSLVYALTRAYQAYDDPVVRLSFDPGTPEDDERLQRARMHAACRRFWHCLSLDGITLGLVVAIIVLAHFPW